MFQSQALLTNGNAYSYTSVARRVRHRTLAGMPRLANAGIKVFDNAHVRNFLLRRMYADQQGPTHTY